jgi:hypothetical protein
LKKERRVKTLPPALSSVKAQIRVIIERANDSGCQRLPVTITLLTCFNLKTLPTSGHF